MAACLYCQSNRSTPLYDVTDIFGDTYTIRQCENCGVHFLDPFPTAEQLKQAYEEDYYGAGESKFKPLIETAVDYFRKLKAKRYAKLIGNKGRVLDIGCGNGSFLENLGLQGEMELHGIEPEGGSAERAAAKPNIRLKKGVLEAGDFPEAHFDLVSLIHVFEHLANPKETMEIISNIVKTGGWLVIEIPNIDSWQSKLFKGHWFHLDPPRHLNLFSPQRLQEEFEKLGFELKSEHHFSPQFNPFGVQQSLLNALGLKRDLLYEHLKGNRTYTKGHAKIGIFLQQLFQWLSFPALLLTDGVAATFKKAGTIRVCFQKRA